MSWTELIGHEGDILWWQMSIRAVLIFIFGLVLIRVFGRRAFGKQNPLDIVVAIIVGSSLSRALTGNAPFIPTIIAMAVLVWLFWVLEHAAARWHWLGRLAKGDPVWLARDHRLEPQRHEAVGRHGRRYLRSSPQLRRCRTGRDQRGGARAKRQVSILSRK